MDRKAHWEKVYRTKQPTEVSWYQAEPTLSLKLLAEVNVGPDATILDVGGGDSMLVDALVTGGFSHVTVLDISGTAVSRAQARLGPRAQEVVWLEADVTRVFLPFNAYDVWHDRAVFHFLTDPEDRARYVATAATALRPGGALIVATFALDGPTRCSGLEVARYSPEGLVREFGHEFALRHSLTDVHRTPSGVEQRFTYALFHRV